MGELRLPPGATLVDDDAGSAPAMKLPPGATLVDAGQSGPPRDEQGRPLINMTSPSGEHELVRQADFRSKLDAGYRVGLPAQQKKLGGQVKPQAGATNVLPPSSSGERPQINPAANFAYHALKPFNPVSLPPTVDEQGNIHVPNIIDQAAHEADLLRHRPVETMKEAIVAPFKGIAEGAQTEIDRARQALSEGSPAQAAVHMVYAGVPVLGPQMGEAAQQSAEGDYSGAAGTMAGLGLQTAMASPETMDAALGMAKRAPGAIGEAISNTAVRNNPVTNALIGPNPETIPADRAFKAAVKPRNSIQEVDAHIERGLPDARRAADSLGIDTSKMTLHDAEAAVAQAKQDVFAEIEGNVLGPNRNMGIDATPVADKITDVARKMTNIQKRRLGGAVDDIHDAAADYRDQVLSFGDIEKRIQELNNQLRSQQAQFKVNEGALRADPKYAGSFAELDGLRQLQRDAFEDLSGMEGGGDYLRDLKQRYGSLKTLQDMLDRRINVAERQGLSGDLYETGGRIAGLGDVAMGALSRDVSKVGAGLVKMQAGKNAALLNDPNFLIQRAFSGTEPRPPMQIIDSGFTPAGLLPPAPIELPPQLEPIEDVGPIAQPAQRGLPARTPKGQPGAGQMRRTYTNASTFQRPPVITGGEVLPPEPEPQAQPGARSFGTTVPEWREGMTRAEAIDWMKRRSGMKVDPNNPGRLVSDTGGQIAEQERRADLATRKLVADMTPEERAEALLTSDKTGLPNRRAFDENEQTAQAPAVAMSDADGLKAFNDKFGYEAGDALLKAKAEALRDAGLDAYHEKGDEFLYRGESPEDIQQKLETARKLLREHVIRIDAADGSVHYFKGADFSYGTGKNLTEAEAGLKAHKSAREATGERARGELRGITEVRPEAGEKDYGATPKKTVGGETPPEGLSRTEAIEELRKRSGLKVDPNNPGRLIRAAK